MSMVKLFYSDSFDTTADVGMRLFEDTSSLKKSASTIFGMDYDALKPDKDHVGIHVVALGAHERYGCNRNFDAFSKAACLKYHDTFVKHGHVYRHHRNKDPEKALGQIKVSAYNPEMDRVELFIHANKEKAADELTRLEKEGEIPFSMAAKVPGDRCSICRTFRKNASDPNQCDHIKNEFGKTYDDGKVAFTFNDEPDFFDISFVGRPADRIAWQLKVASADTASSIKLAEYEGVTLPDSLAIDSKIGLRKLAHLKAVVYMHDAYRGWFTKTAQQKSSRDFYLYELRKAAGAKLPDSVIARLREFEPTAAFTAMAKAGMVMDVESFFKYAMGPEYPQLQDLMPEISLAVPRVMKTAVDSGTCQNLCNVSTFDVPERQSYMAGEVPGSIIVKMASAAVVGQPRDERIIAATVEQKNIKFAVDTAKKIESNTALTGALAEKYAAYQLSAIDAVLSFHDTDPDYVRAISAAQNLMM